MHNRAGRGEFRGAGGVIFIDRHPGSASGKPGDFQRLWAQKSPSRRSSGEIKDRNVHVIDATCPLVTKVHLEVHKYVRDGYTIMLIGHKEHDEVVGTTGEAPDKIQVVGSVEEVARLQVPDPNKVVCLDADNACSADEMRGYRVQRLKTA